MKSHCSNTRYASERRRRGSALLIVLGFLSFMMVSAVSFAIYMRIERQASSNYRHTTTARHLLNAALFRAIDEIDSELRFEKVDGTARPLKFPEWPGRAKPSAVPNGMDNAQEARVLSMEALSFLPAVFVNDVRRYAVTNKLDKSRTFKGAKWRSLSMPVSSLVGGENAYEEAIVGRYSYVCVNVSDMLDVNVCKAAMRDALTNRVSIGHLFGPNSDTKRKAFDTDYKERDFHYSTMQDFYACMYENGDTVFGSPYHEYMNAGKSDKADEAFKTARNHLFVPDSIVKAQPTRDNACNISRTQPLSGGILTAVHPDPSSITLKPEFLTALRSTLAGQVPGGANSMLSGATFATMLADYIDTDGIPKALNLPSVEMAPMISQILVPDFFAPIVIKKTVDIPGPPPRQKNIYALQMVGAPTAAQIDVEVVWPFKNMKDRKKQPSFKMELKVFLKPVKVHALLNSQSFIDVPIPPTYAVLTGEADVPDFWATDTSDPTKCYNKVSVPIVVNQTAVPIDMIDSEDGVIDGSGFVEGQSFSVACVVFARIKQGSDYVDSVPQVAPYPGIIDPTAEFIATQQKLFFQTVPSPPVARVMTVNVPIKYEWTSLEVPDPRFNYKASNWLKNTEVNAIVPKMNASTLALLGQDGRDGDIYMSVSDAGRLQSPGELGFIVRPFVYDPLGKPVDFRTRVAVDPTLDDSDAYFRTIRLYDHGNPADKINCAHDPVYEYFTVQNPDGSVAGARVNPLSDIPMLFTAAIESTPVDYYYSALNPKSDLTAMQKNTFNKVLSTGDWQKFTNGWSQCLLNARKTANLNTSWKVGLSDVYADQDTFGWYSEGVADRIFNTKGGFAAAGVPASLSKPLHEIDRKMLMSYSLESFSDRQGLYLYILRAEVTVPSFGTTQEQGTRSLAGGRAVALVWRDPYPAGYDKAKDSWLNKGAARWYSNNSRISPWYQVNIDKYNDDHESYDNDPDTDTKRFDGYHEHRVLFFKQMDN